MKTSVLITSYYPPISYFSAIKHSSTILLEAHEHYDRQTIRNRCYLLTANGPQHISVPIVKPEKKDIQNIYVDYSTQWNQKHAYAIKSAYGKTPFFIYYFDELIEPLFKQHSTLFNLNLAIVHTCLKLLKLPTSINFTQSYQKLYPEANDYRTILIKKKPPFLTHHYPSKPYLQAFSNRHSFIEDLSILDLLFNVGFEAIYYL